jgi:hypothetical protein
MIFCTLSLGPCFPWLAMALGSLNGEGAAPALQPKPAELPPSLVRAAEVQVNTFTWSNQEAAALAQDAQGASVVVWHSRRQQGGNYGVYARRFDAQGKPVTPEIEVNHFTWGPQTLPSVALDAQGRAWIAWESLGQDGDAGAIVARRFDAELSTRSAEIVVNEVTAGHQGEVALACAADGTALVAWTTPGSDEGKRSVAARFLGADGRPLGAAFSVGATARATLPAVAAHPGGGWTVVWSEHGLDGRPRAICARRFDAEGAPLGTTSELFAAEARMPVEPVVRADGAGGLLAAWLVAEGEDYVPHAAQFAWDGEQRSWKGGSVLRLPDEGPGYTSGIDVAVLGDGRFLLAWTRFVESRDARLRARILAPDGASSEPFAVTGQAAGAQRLAVGGGATRVSALPDGRLAFVWHGDSGGGDASAANLSLLWPAGLEPAPTAAAAPTTVARFQVTPEEEGAGPHEPPIGSGGAVRREDFGDTKSLSGPDFGFLGIPQTSLTPPDPHAAVGPGHAVEIVNGAIAYFTRAGTFQFQQAIDGPGGFWASVGANGFIFDPEVIFDPDSRRFMAMANERSGSAFFLLAVSDNDDPNGTWHKYRFNVTAAAGDTDIDSPNLGVDATAVYMSADFFGPDKYLTFIVQKAPVLSGGVPTTRSLLHVGSQSWGIPVMYDAAPAYYMAESFETPVSSTLRLHAITNPLGVPVDTTFDLAVPAYQQPEDPPQMGTSTRPETFEARFWSCVFRDGRLYATHHTGASRVLQRWYEIDMANWPSSGVPTLVQSGDVDPGPGLRSFFGSIGVDGQGNVGLVYARSGSSEFISMARSYHLFGSLAGSTTPSVIMKTSSSPDTSGRWGDYSACVADPDFDRVFWGVHEFRTASWATWLGTFGPCSPPTNYCTAKVNSQGGTPTIGFIGEPSLGSNNFRITLSNGVAGNGAIYIFGDGPAATPFANAFLCIAPPLTRSGNHVIGAGGSLNVQIPIEVADLGRTRYFQWWYRDPPHPDGTGVGLSNALELTFCP